MITRRSLLASFVAAPALPLGGLRCSGNDQHPDREPILLYSFYVAGYQYYSGWERALHRELASGTELMLRRESDNEYDHRAVEVLTQTGIKLGYLPRWINKIPSSMLDQGATLKCRVEKVNQDDYAEHTIKVRLEMMATLARDAAHT